MSYKHDTIVYDIEDDIWLPLDEFPGYYISNTGHVWGPGHGGKGQLLKPYPNNQYGHLGVKMTDKYGKKRHCNIHRLVAENFIPNPHNYPIVRHLDSCAENNDVENLAWGTQYDNMHDCIAEDRFRYFTEEDREAAMRKRRTPVTAVNLTNGEKLEFISQQEASRVLKIEQSCISAVINGKNKHASGYYFYYTDSPKEINIADYRYSRHRALIKSTDLSTGEEHIFTGQTEAARVLGLSVSSISMVLSGRYTSMGGYRFEYVNCD